MERPRFNERATFVVARPFSGPNGQLTKVGEKLPSGVPTTNLRGLYYSGAINMLTDQRNDVRQQPAAAARRGR